MYDNEDQSYFADENATFGDRVEAARLGLGLSQENLARKLGVKAKTVRAWEENLSEPRANKLQMMAGLLNVTIMWLLTGDGEGLTQPVEDDDIGDDMREILMELRRARAEMSALADHIGALERRLSRALAHG